MLNPNLEAQPELVLTGTSLRTRWTQTKKEERRDNEESKQKRKGKLKMKDEGMRTFTLIKILPLLMKTAPENALSCRRDGWKRTKRKRLRGLRFSTKKKE